MIKKLLVCTILLSIIAVSISAARVRSLKIEETSIFAEAPGRRPVKGGGSGGFKTEETPVVFAEAPNRRPVKGGGSGGFKTEETPFLLEGQMGPAGSGSGGATSSGKKKGRRGKNEEIPVLAEGFPMPALLEAHRNLRKFH